jgi:hypothetical protein
MEQLLTTKQACPAYADPTFMSDPNPQDHWNFLASELGAEPAAEGAAPPPRPASPPPRPPRTEKPAKPKPPAASTDWADLAGSLGLEVPPEERIPPPSKPVPYVPPPAVSAEMPSGGEPVHADRPPRERGHREHSRERSDRGRREGRGRRGDRQGHERSERRRDGGERHAERPDRPPRVRE